MQKNTQPFSQVSQACWLTDVYCIVESLNDKACMVIPNPINLNHVELKYYPFMVSLDKCNGSCNVLSSKIIFPKETKNINVKVFIIITNKNEARTMAKLILCDCK